MSADANRFLDGLFRHRGWVPVPFILYALAAADPGGPSLWGGIAAMALGEAIRLWGAAHLGRTARSSRIRTAKLVTTGPYAHTRHPLYWGNFLLTLGFTLATGAGRPWFPILVGTAFLVLYGVHARREEAALAAVHPQAHAVYRSRVPGVRWLRRPASVPGAGEGGRPSLGQALRVEAWTMHAEGWLLIALWVRTRWL